MNDVFNPPLPVDAVLSDVVRTLEEAGRLVLQAPPGAGKTTRVPLALLQAGFAARGRIVMLEPRRLAAIAAAERMAETLREAVGGRVGYRIRGESRIGPETQIEVVTEGILTRMIQQDPGLEGVGTIIFDEFHERSLNADLGLALALEVRAALREDLALLVMSATLDAAPVAQLMGEAPLITSEGRAFPVETIWREAPIPAPAPGRWRPRDAALVETVLQAAAETEGGLLVFLPGEAEIRRAASALEGRLPGDCVLLPLYGALKPEAQRRALRPLETGRKVVLATAIAETSLTIDGVRVVVDAGLARRARFDPGSGMSRLVTERVTRAEADQRRGRAGRVAPGRCYRLWTKGEDGALSAFPPPEIAAGDLAALALELAEWGAEPAALPFLTQPPEGALAAARRLLVDLGALADDGSITAHGKQLARMPLHPRLGHMLAKAAKDAAPEAAALAALLGDRDILRGAGSDLSLRLDALRGRRRASDLPGELHQGALARIRKEARRLERMVPATGGQADAPAELLALAYPDRIGLRRPGEAPRWILSGGKGACLPAEDPLAQTRLLVAADLDGDTREARVRLALPISEASLRAVHGDRIAWRDVCRWSRRHRRVEARQQEVLGALVLDDRGWRDAPGKALARAALDGVRELGLEALNFSPAARRFRARVELLRAGGEDLPDMSDAGLLAEAEAWLLPYLDGRRTAEQLRALDLLEPLRSRLDWAQMQRVEALAPARYETPAGTSVPIDYEGEAPGIDVRLQQMFGLTRHPTVGPDRRPLRIALLSPAGRPVQVTMDLPGFWASSYDDVRKDMRGRYPKHPWPEDPTAAPPTTRAKQRKR